jgi:glycosyltransferase involved in cell wall biosynthesis
MRLLHVIPYFHPAWAYGGPCRAAWELARALTRKGHEIVALTTDALDAHHRAKPEFEIVEGVEIHRVPNLSNRLAWSRLFLPLGFGAKLKAELDRADVVHLHEYRSFQNAVALPLIQRLGKPFVLTAHGGLPRLVSRYALKQAYDALVGRRLIQRANRLHALNSMEREQFAQLGGQPEQIAVVSHGINVDDYRTLPPASAETFRRKYNIPADAPLVLFLARLNKIKGVDFLVSAFAEVRRELPQAVLVLAGPDDGYLAEVKRQIESLGLADSVRFTGYLDGAAKIEAYQAADVYVLPSMYEILGLTLLEALACRATVLTTDRCGLADSLQQNDLGAVVKFGDVIGLKDEIVRALRNPADAQLAERRRNHVLANFSWEAIAERWETIYQQCVMK